MTDKPKALVKVKVTLDNYLEEIVAGHHLELTDTGHLVIFNSDARMLYADRPEKVIQWAYAAGTWRSVARVSEESA